MVTRLFYLEPFLIRPERHFIEVTLAIYSYLLQQSSYQFFIIGNKRLTQEVKDLIPNVIPAISQTPFEDLEDYGRSFFEDLMFLDNIYTFTKEDLIILPSSYENQIIAIAKFASFKSHLMPKVAIQFHQIFPPTKDSNDILKDEFRSLWYYRLKIAFQNLSSSAITLWTTESKELKKTLEIVSNRSVGTLPVPFFVLPSDLDHKGVPSDTNRIGFLGEGRQEKGLLLLLRAIEKVNQEANRFSFIIQNMNPRGYPENELGEFSLLMSKMRGYDNVEVIEGGISPVDYHKTLLSLDCVVLPYNPVNYWRRVSGVQLQAAIYNIPAIVSSGTWCETLINERQSKGIVFQYNINSLHDTVQNLADSLKNFLHIKQSMNEDMLSSGEYIRRHNNAANYLTKIMASYPI